MDNVEFKKVCKEIRGKYKVDSIWLNEKTGEIYCVVKKRWKKYAGGKLW